MENLLKEIRNKLDMIGIELADLRRKSAENWSAYNKFTDIDKQVKAYKEDREKFIQSKNEYIKTNNDIELREKQLYITRDILEMAIRDIVRKEIQPLITKLYEKYANRNIGKVIGDKISNELVSMLPAYLQDEIKIYFYEAYNYSFSNYIKTFTIKYMGIEVGEFCLTKSIVEEEKSRYYTENLLLTTDLEEIKTLEDYIQIADKYTLDYKELNKKVYDTLEALNEEIDTFNNMYRRYYNNKFGNINHFQSIDTLNNYKYANR